MDWGVNDVIPGSDGQGILVTFEKSSQLKFGPGKSQSSCGLRDARRVCWVSELRFWLWAESSAGELTVGDVGTVSIVKIVSLSPHVEKLKVKEKLNKRFVPELPKVVSVSRDSYACEHFTHSYFEYATHRACLDYCPVLGPTLKRPCAKLVGLVGRTTNR